MTKNRRYLTIAGASILVLAVVATGCSRTSAPPEVAEQPSTHDQDRPQEGTGAFPWDAPGFLDAAELREQEAQAEASERERILAEREAELAAREAELATREAQARQVSRSPSPPRATAPPQVPLPAPAPVAEAPPPPRPAPPPPPLSVTVPAQTEVVLELTDDLSTTGNQAGDFVRARVASAVHAGGVAAIPAGARLTGSVTEARSPGNIGGRARLAVHFDRLELPWGEVVPVSLTFVEEGRDESGRDAATIAGGAAGGAVLGRVLKRGDSKRDQRKAAAIGAVLGAAVGTTIAARTAGEEVELPSGSTLALALGSSVSVNVPR
jgi:hypothetical protein